MILKLHGAIDRADANRDSYVITEDSYIDYLVGGDVGEQIPFTLRERMARQPLPLPRLLDARLEPARDPEPDLGRAAARSQVVGGAAGAGRCRDARGRGSALAGPRRRRAALRPARRIRRLERALADRCSDEPRIERPALPATPYVGLVPYGEADAGFFFGRDEEKRIVTGNLRASRLTILYGPSGVGKTSLLRAGVVHDLRTQMLEAARAQPERAPFAVCVFAAWRDDPLAALMAALTPRRSRRSAAGSSRAGGRATRLSRRCAPGRTACGRCSSSSTSSRTTSSTTATRTALTIRDGARRASSTTPNLRVNVLLSIREDAWAKLDRFEGRIPQLFANYVRVEHLEPRRPRARRSRGRSPSGTVACRRASAPYADRGRSSSRR